MGEIMTVEENKITFPFLITALNSCAIEGNRMAQRKLALLKDDPEGFAAWAEKFLSPSGWNFPTKIV
jgi:hypothetical protein